jgi:tRNA G10  N-methylase Trm11
LDVKPGQQILDPACGAGEFLVEAGRAGAAVAGIDISPIAIELAKINLYLCSIKE